MCVVDVQVPFDSKLANVRDATSNHNILVPLLPGEAHPTGWFKDALETWKANSTPGLDKPYGCYPRVRTPKGVVYGFLISDVPYTGRDVKVLAQGQRW